MKLNEQMKKLLLVVLFALGTGAMIGLRSQTPGEVLATIYGKYDSLSYLTFDVRYTYTSDTVYGDFIYDALEGVYTMSGKKALFKLGAIEYMQNDSFFIALHPQDNIIIVSDPRHSNSGSFLPMREEIDSLMIAYAAHYDISATANDSLGYINFLGLDSIARFQNFQITYDVDSKYIVSLSYTFQEFVQADEEMPYDYMWRKRLLKVEFLNYRFENFSDNMYDENNYVFFENGECKPLSKYEGFRVFYSRSGVVQEIAQ